MNHSDEMANVKAIVESLGPAIAGACLSANAGERAALEDLRSAVNRYRRRIAEGML